jgi:hypothetical protein
MQGHVLNQDQRSEVRFDMSHDLESTNGLH